MTPEKQRIAIAEACGWILPINQNYYALPLHIRGHAGKKDGINLGQWTELPDFCNDLNAMHEAEKMLSNDQCDTYETHLCKAADKVVTDWITEKSKSITIATTYCFHATAAQRAEAFLKTIGKWEEE